MKKVININFQGRVLPIEETAYDLLQRYVDSLRLFFANEEGRDEIINDIEGRIAELFGETLKKGSICITDEDVNKIIDSMGRPEDFDDDEAKVHSQLGGQSNGRSYEQAKTTTGRGKLYRDENHKVLGGVCGGIANYFAIDPIIIRILFLLFIGITFFPYLILWVVVPSSSSLMIGSQRRRLFRDTETKMLAGVCSGLAQYFSVQVWIPRLLFLIPFFSFVFRWGNWGWWDFPHFLSFSFSPASIFIYIILWLVLPVAKTSADKLEMKGEKVDLNTIKTTIQSDLEGFKDRAQQFGSELKERAQTVGEELGSAGKRFGEEASAAGKRFGTEAGVVGKRTGSGLAHVLGAIIKIFIYFFIGCILLAVVIGLFSLGAVLTGLLPAYSYVLDSRYQEILAWCSLAFFVWVPVIAIVTFIIRKLMGKKGNSGIIRLTFLSFWIFGLICFVNLVISISNQFRYRNNPYEQPVTLSNPKVNKLEIKTTAFGKYYSQNWLRLEPFASFDDDTVYVRNVRLRIIKSTSDSFQVLMVKLANGNSKAEAERTVFGINYNIMQSDSLLLLDKGLAITKQGKFRNQQVIVTVAVPVGKRILVNENVGWDDNVRVNMGRGDDYWDWDNDMESESLHWDHNVEYVMTGTGLERVNKEQDTNNENNDEEDKSNAIEQFRKSKEQMEREKEQKLKELQEIDRELQKTTDSTRYRYQPGTPQTDRAPVKKAKETVKNTAFTNTGAPEIMPDILMIKYAL